MTQLDHMTRGRAMLGVGSGVLVSDAMMLGVKTADQRRRMQESVEVIVRSAARRDRHEGDRLVCAARRAPAIAAIQRSASGSGDQFLANSGVRSLAGQWGLGMVSISGTSDPALQALFDNWTLAEQNAARHGQQSRSQPAAHLLPDAHSGDAREGV